MTVPPRAFSGGSLEALVWEGCRVCFRSYITRTPDRSTDSWGRAPEPWLLHSVPRALTTDIRVSWTDSCLWGTWPGRSVSISGLVPVSPPALSQRGLAGRVNPRVSPVQGAGKTSFFRASTLGDRTHYGGNSRHGVGGCKAIPSEFKKEGNCKDHGRQISIKWTTCFCSIEIIYRPRDVSWKRIIMWTNLWWDLEKHQCSTYTKIYQERVKIEDLSFINEWFFIGLGFRVLRELISVWVWLSCWPCAHGKKGVSGSWIFRWRVFPPNRIVQSKKHCRGAASKCGTCACSASYFAGSVSMARGHGNPPQDSCLENAMDRGAW